MEKHTIWNLTKEPILIFQFRTNEKPDRVFLGNLMQNPQGSTNFQNSSRIACSGRPRSHKVVFIVESI